MARRSTSVYHSLREVFSAATFRALLDLRDAGEVFLARIKSLSGGVHYNTDGDADVWVHVIDEVTGHPSMARLHIPGNILFSLPEAEDTVMVARPRDVDAPGASYVLHGDGGDKTRFPSWIATKVGLFTKKILRLESSSEAVEIQSGSGKDIVLNAGTAKVGRVGDQITIPNVIFDPGSGGASLEMNGVTLGLTPQNVTGTITAGANNVKA